MTSYRQSGFGGLVGLSVPLNYEYMALDCVTFNIRIGDDLLSRIIGQILQQMISKVKCSATSKFNKISTFLFAISIPNLKYTHNLEHKRDDM